MLRALERRLDRLGHVLMGWWVWPAFLAFLGAAVVAVSWIVAPAAGTEQLYIASFPFGSECAFRVEHGIPCPSCGMTRSWVWAARGNLVRAFTYNAAGASLFVGFVAGGVLGVIRLFRQRADVAAVPYKVVVVGALGWFFVLYLGLWGLRIAGVNPLP